MSFDPKCLDLARHFLGHSVSEALAKALAQHIQDEVKFWMEFEKRRLAKERGERQPDTL
jgi:hypothetical protein